MVAATRFLGRISTPRSMLRCIAATISLAFVAATAQTASSVVNATSSVDVVLFGATGNLASKYLWQSLLELADALHPTRLHVVAVGVMPAVAGATRLREAVAHGTHCGSLGVDATLPSTIASCNRLRDLLLSDVVYLSTASGDYSVLAYHLTGVGGPRARDEPSMIALGALALTPREPLSRLLYFAVSPDLYVPILEKLHASTALSSGDTGSQRIVLEKPFGRDRASAQALLSGIKKLMLQPSPAPRADGAPAAAAARVDRPTTAAASLTSQLLLVDHYLGKPGLAAAADARLRLQRSRAWRLAVGEDFELEGADSRVRVGASAGATDDADRAASGVRSLSLVEVVLSEDDPLETGRAGSASGPSAAPTFYNEYGAVRDVLATHATVMAAATLLEGRGAEATWTRRARRAVLRRLSVVPEDARAGAPRDGPRPHRLTAFASAAHRFGFYSGYERAVLGIRADNETTDSSIGSDVLHRCSVFASADEPLNAVDDVHQIDGRVLVAGTTANHDASATRASGPPYIVDEAKFAAASGHWPRQADVWGPHFVAPTAAQVAFALNPYADATAAPEPDAQPTLVLISGGKALARRTAFVRHTYDDEDDVDRAAAASRHCGPLTVTYHIDGALTLPPILPPGDVIGRLLRQARAAASTTASSNSTAPVSPRRRDPPAVIITGWCGAHLDAVDPASIFSAPVSNALAVWPRGWAVASDTVGPDASGVVVAVAHLPPSWSSRLLREWGGASTTPGTARRMTTRPLTRSDDANGAAFAALRLVARNVGSSSSPYPALLAAALLASEARSSGDNDSVDATTLFVGTTEALESWALWSPVVRSGDAASAAGYALHWHAPALQSQYDCIVSGAVATGASPVTERRSPDGAAPLSLAVGNAPALPDRTVVVYRTGDASWMRGPVPRGREADFRWGMAQGSTSRCTNATAPALNATVVAPGLSVERDETASARTGVPVGAAHGSCSLVAAHGTMVCISSIVTNDGSGDAPAHFAADVAATLWSAVVGRRSSGGHGVAHWAADAGAELRPFYARLAALEVSPLLPRHGFNLWSTAERDTTPGSPQCGLCYLARTLVAPLQLPPEAFHALRHPDASYADAVAARRTAVGRGMCDETPAFDLVTLRLPVQANGSDGAAQDSSSDSSNGTLMPAVEQLGLWYSVNAASGNDGGDEFVEGGSIDEPSFYRSYDSSALARAAADEAHALSQMDPARAAALRASAAADAPLSAPRRPVLPHRGPMDVRITRGALRRARDVWVIVPASRFVLRDGDAVATVVINSGGAGDADADVKTQRAQANASGYRGASLPGAQAIPAQLVKDLAVLTAGRTGPVRLYVGSG